jgi:hypothetical protein
MADPKPDDPLSELFQHALDDLDTRIDRRSGFENPFNLLEALRTCDWLYDEREAASPIPRPEVSVFATACGPGRRNQDQRRASSDVPDGA